MSSYTKAKVWDQVYSTMVNLPSGIASTASALNAMNQNSINRDLEDRYEEYQAVVDYADSHSVNPAYDSREGFIQAASAATGVDRKFVKNVLDSVNWDPTRTNNSTLTDWMAQNGYGTNSWKRNYITKKTAENSRSLIVDTLKQGVSDFAETNMLEGPYTYFDNERKMRYQLRKLSDTAKIAEVTGIPKDYVDNLIASDQTIMEEVNEWFDGEFTDKLREYETQQQSANIATQTQSVLDVHVLQCINNNTSDIEFAQGVLSIINSTGYSAAFDKGMTDRMIASSIASYMSQYAVDFAKTNYMLSDSQFFRRYESDMTTKRDSIVKAFGDSGVTDGMISYADSAIYKALGKAYETKNKELEDSTEAYTEAQADKIKSDLEYASTELKNRLSTANYDISNGKAYKYSSMSIDDFVKEVSNETFQSKDELLAWCNKNGKNDIYKSFLELHTNAISKHESEKQEEISATANGIKLNGVKKADELIQKINTDQNKYATWTNDDIAKSIGFDSYEAYMNNTDPNKQSLFSRINSAIESAKKSVDEEKANASKEKQSKEDIALTIKTDEIVRQINDAPSLYYNKNEDFAAQQIGFDSYEAYKNGSPTQHQVSCFNSIMKAIGQAGNDVSNEAAEIKKATDEERKQLRSQYTTIMKDNSSAIIELAKSGLLHTPDRLASILSLGKFEDSNDLMDNASPEIKTLYIDTLSKMDDAYAEYTGININGVAESALNARKKNLTGSVNVGYVSFTGYHADIIKGTPDSYNEDKFQLFNDDSEPIADFTLKKSSVEVRNPFEETYEWIDNDYALAEGNEVTSRIYDIDAFNSYVDRFHPDMKDNTKFMKTLIAQWNKAYCSIPTSEEVMEKYREATFSEAFSMAMNGDKQGAQLLMAEKKSYWPDDKSYADDLKKISITISDDVKSVVNYVEKKIKDMLPEGSEYSYNLYKYMNIDEATATRLQAEITKNPADREKILSDFADSCFLNLQSDKIKEYYRELNSTSVPTFRDYGKGTADYSGNAADIFARYVSGKPVVGSLDANTFSVMYNALMSSDKVNVLDTASSILFSDGNEELDFTKLSDFQKNMVYAAALPVVYLKDKSSYMVDRLKNVKGINEGDLKIVTFNNDVAVLDVNSQIMYTIPVNTKSREWLKYNVKSDVISSIGDSDFLYRIGSDDAFGIDSGSSFDIGNLIVSSRSGTSGVTISENTSSDYLTMGDDPTATKVRQAFSQEK